MLAGSAPNVHWLGQRPVSERLRKRLNGCGKPVGNYKRLHSTRSAFLSRSAFSFTFTLNYGQRPNLDREIGRWSYVNDPETLTP